MYFTTHSCICAVHVYGVCVTIFGMHYFVSGCEIIMLLMELHVLYPIVCHPLLSLSHTHALSLSPPLSLSLSPSLSLPLSLPLSLSPSLPLSQVLI